MKAERNPAFQDPWCMGGTLGRRDHQQRRGHWEWRPKWHWMCNWGIYSASCQGSEGGSAGGEMLLPLQWPRAFYLWLPIGEGIQNWSIFKPKGGDGTKEGSPGPYSKGGHTKGTPRWFTQGIWHYTQTPFLNPDPFHWWYGVENIAWVRVNGESCMALLDNDTQINSIMPGFVENCSLNVRPLPDLVGGWVTCVGLGNALTKPMGYVIIWVQVDGVQGYDEDQIALVIPDLSNFAAWVPMILETPTISHVMNMIEEKEIHSLVTPWVSAWMAYLLAVRWATAMV